MAVEFNDVREITVDMVMDLYQRVVADIKDRGGALPAHVLEALYSPPLNVVSFQGTIFQVLPFIPRNVPDEQIIALKDIKFAWRVVYTEDWIIIADGFLFGVGGVEEINIEDIQSFWRRVVRSFDEWRLRGHSKRVLQ